MQVRIRLYAFYRDQAGTDRTELTLTEGATVSGAIAQLMEELPSLPRTFQPHLMAVNDEFASVDYPLHDGDEIALYPPVSGGVVDVGLTHEPLDPSTVADLVRRSTNGAIVTMEGTTRDITAGRRVLYLDYEADEAMAEKVLGQVLEEAANKFGVSDLAVRHRVGHLEIGDTSMVVAVGGRHRTEAFFAAQYAVDRIKQIVPIWKKEAFEDGSVWAGSQYKGHEHPPIDYDELMRVAAPALGYDTHPEPTSKNS